MWSSAQALSINFWASEFLETGLGSPPAITGMADNTIAIAAIAISLPVALVVAKYLGVAPEVIFFSSLATAGMPFVLLVGAAPNAIAYGSGQFKSGEFFLAGIPASIVLMLVLWIFVGLVWPLMGMPVLMPIAGP